jgi:hypothetical protein
LKRLLALIILILNITACSPVIMPVSTTATVAATITPIPILTSTSKPSATPEPSVSATNLPTVTPTITPQPTYTVLRGVVNQGHVNCYYGPSKAYLYKYGLLKGNRLDIIGIIEDTGYIEVQAIGGDNPCWMNLEFMDVQGDIHSVKPVDPLTINMPWSPYYPALNFAKAIRNGNEVTISWSPLKLRAGDDSEQESYLLETWVCRNGKLTFVPIGAYQNKATVMDEPGCSEPSFGRVYGVEKHGYTKYLKFDWPQAEGQSN